MSSEEQKQSEAILIGVLIISLWVSHYPAVWWPDLYGNYDLKKLLLFWNMKIWINLPIAFVCFLSIFQLVDRCGNPSRNNLHKKCRLYRPIK